MPDGPDPLRQKPSLSLPIAQRMWKYVSNHVGEQERPVYGNLLAGNTIFALVALEHSMRMRASRNDQVKPMVKYNYRELYAGA